MEEVAPTGCRRRWFRWRPTSDEQLEAAEASILKSLNVSYEGRYVTTSQQDKIWTVTFNPQGNKTPVLMVHGFGAGLGMWSLNIKELSENRPIHTFDVLGFGRSSRPTFDEDPEVVEGTFVDAIEDTRKELGLEKFVLIGHSFGGYLASSYAIKHPEQVKSLILADPWGFAEKPQDWEKTVSIPIWVKVVAAILQPFNPFSAIRFAGPLGPSVLRRFRPDLQRKFSRLFPDDTMINYIYHCNAQTPSGETGFKRLVHSYAWPKYPMGHRIGYLNSTIRVSMVFGSQSWIDNSVFEEIKAERPDQFDIFTIEDAGHHVYADKPRQFNELMIEKFENVDDQEQK